MAVATKLTITPEAPSAGTVMLAGSVNTGPALSSTVTVKLPVLVFPCKSTAEQLTVVVPIENNEPDAGKQVTGTGPSTKSLAEAVKLTVAPEMLVAGTVILAGNVNTGPALSTTVTVKLPLPVFRCLSVAEQLTVVCPIGNNDPEAGKQVTATDPSTRSFAEVEKLTVAPAALVAATVILAGSDKIGAVVSTTVTVKLAVPVLL